MTGSSQKTRRFLLFTLILGMAIVLLSVWRLQSGAMDIPWRHVMSLLNPMADPSLFNAQEAIVVRAVRLPRLIASLGAGAALSTSGVVLQAMLHNPLAEPYTLGIAAGAALGAAIGIFAGGIWVPAAAFLGAIVALGLAFALAWRSGGGSPLHMVLAGIVVSAILSAGVTLVKVLAEEKVSAIVIWLMGSFSGASMSGSLYVLAGAVAVFIPAWYWGNQLDAVSLGEGRATYLGVDEKRIRIVMLGLASLSTALVVASFGIIGFIGLVAPHLLRMLIGPSHRALLITSFFFGALLLAGADGLARELGEVPVGVVTSLLGGPVFCWILLRERGK